MSFQPSAAEWSRMRPDERRRVIADMSQIQAAEFYASLPANKTTGPRLNPGEWAALGRAGQQYLLREIPGWEAEIVRGWGVAEPYTPPVAQAAREEAPRSDGGWSPKDMHNFLFWSCIIPPLGWVLFVFNFWRPGRLAQSFGLLIAGLFMFFFGYPAVCGFIAALASTRYR